MRSVARRASFAFVLMVAAATTGVFANGCATAGGDPAGLLVTSNVPDAAMYIDDVYVGRASEWARAGRFVTPGFHRIELRHPAYHAHFAEVTLASGRGGEVHATLRPLLD